MSATINSHVMSSSIVNQTLLADYDVTVGGSQPGVVVRDADHLTHSTSSPFTDAFLLENIHFSKVLNGYVAPFFVAATIVTNLLVCLVLVRPGMRTATNAVLVAVAFSDSMTGLAPLPCYIYFYTLGGHKEYVPYRWCFWYFCLMEYLPTVFHTASVWLTVLLAAQRYVCVCRGDLPRARTARRRSVVVKVIVCIFIMAVASQASRFFEFDFVSVDVRSLVEPKPTIVAGCHYKLTPFIADHEKEYFTTVYVLRVIFIHLIPGSALVVLTMLLVCALRTAQRRKRNLLVRAAGSSTAVTVTPSTSGTGQGTRRSSNDGNNTTMMLVTVVSVFLAVEIPLAVLLVLIIIQHTFTVTVLDQQAGGVASLVTNLIILVSYPTNFFIYCAMSRAFRTTFRNMFCSFNSSIECSTGNNRGGDVVMTTMPTVTRQRAHGKLATDPQRYGGNAPAVDGYLPMTEMMASQITDVSVMRKSRRSVTHF